MPDLRSEASEDRETVDSSLWIKAPHHILRVEGTIARRLQGRQSFWAWWMVVNKGGTLDAAQDRVYLSGLRARLVFFSVLSIGCFCLSLFYLCASFVDLPYYILPGFLAAAIYGAAVGMALYLVWQVYPCLKCFRADISAGIERENLLSTIAGNDERLNLIYDYMPPWLRYLLPKPKTIEAAVNLVLNNLGWYIDRPTQLLTADHVLTSRMFFYFGALILLAGSLLVEAGARSILITIPYAISGVVFATFSDLHEFKRRVIWEEMLRYIAAIKLAGARD